MRCAVPPDLWAPFRDLRPGPYGPGYFLAGLRPWEPPKNNFPPGPKRLLTLDCMFTNISLNLEIPGGLRMGRQQFRSVGAWGFQLHRPPRAALRLPWADRGCPVGAQRCCPFWDFRNSVTQTPRHNLPRVAGTKCPGGAAAKDVRENVELTAGQRSMSASCRCATPTRGPLSGPPDVGVAIGLQP